VREKRNSGRSMQCAVVLLA